MTLNLEKGFYQSKVIIQKQRYRNFCIGLCTGWNIPALYVNTEVDIIGTTFTCYGSYIILRNLLANQDIKVLIILDTNPLGQNNVGKHGLQLLYDIFINSNIHCIEYDVRELINTLEIYYITKEKLINISGS